MIDKLDLLSKDELKELVRIYARNIYALDGVWFQSVEGKNGMDEAMLHDENAWRKFTRTEARRIKKFLELPEQAGLEGLEKALAIRFSALSNPSVSLSRKEILLYIVSMNAGCRLPERIKACRFILVRRLVLSSMMDLHAS